VIILFSKKWGLMGSMKELTIILLLVFALPSLAFANIFMAPSCSPADVQLVVNMAVDGDTIVVPSGSCTWTDGAVAIPDDKTLEIVGPGASTLNIIPARISGFKLQSLTAANTWIPYDTPNTDFHPPTPYAAVSSLPATPTNLAINAVSSSQIIMSWTPKSGNASGFRIERCSSAGCSDFAQIATVGANASIYSDGSLDPNTVYSYRVCSYNAAGNSGYSNTAMEATLREDSQVYGLYSWNGSTN
jgi:Fibronectin type III domain